MLKLHAYDCSGVNLRHPTKELPVFASGMLTVAMPRIPKVYRPSKK
jgi:hypothetical protein